MRTIAYFIASRLCLALLLCVPAIAAAQEKPDCPTPKPPERVADAKFWAVVSALGTSAAADYITTRQVLDNGGAENNPLFGRHPSVARQVAIGGAGFAAQILLAYELKKFSRRHRWARGLWLIEPSVQTGMHLVDAGHNTTVLTRLPLQEHAEVRR